MTYTLRLVLLRDATFGRGDGVAGLVDAEVEHDEHGLPFLRGRALKGMLVYECADILFSLKQRLSEDKMSGWYEAARFLFGEPGSQLSGRAQLHIGNACLSYDLRQAIAYQMSLLSNEQKGQLRTDVLNALTTIRRQTAVEPDGVAKDSSLRAMRLIVRQTEFEAELTFAASLTDPAKGLLAACVKAFRRAGTGRQRGPGLLKAGLYQDGNPITENWFNLFKREVT